MGMLVRVVKRRVAASVLEEMLRTKVSCKVSCLSSQFRDGVQNASNIHADVLRGP